MKHRFQRRTRRWLPFLMTGGMLFQAGGGCQAEATQLTANLVSGITTSIISQLITERIAGLLNAPTF